MHKVSGSSMGSSGLTQKSFPCPASTHVTKRYAPVNYNIYFTFVNVFIIFTTTSKIGSGLLSPLWKATGTHNQPYKLCSGEVWGSPGTYQLQGSSGKGPHQLMPCWVQLLHGKVQGRHQWTAGGSLTGYSLPCNLYCHLLAVKQAQEERTILGCTWWLHWSHVMLVSYSGKVFLHPSCTPQHLELKQLELGLGWCDAAWAQQPARGSAEASNDAGQRWNYTLWHILLLMGFNC